MTDKMSIISFIKSLNKIIFISSIIIEMKSIAIHASPKQLSRLRNGHSVRLKKGAEDGMKLLVDDLKHAKLTKAFMKGSGVQVSLSKEEMDANREMGGEGIYGGKITAKQVKDVAKKVANVGKKVAVRAEKAVRENPRARQIVKKQIPRLVEKGVAKLVDKLGDEDLKADLIEASREIAEGELASAGYGMPKISKKTQRALKSGAKKVGKEVVRTGRRIARNEATRELVRTHAPRLAKKGLEHITKNMKDQELRDDLVNWGTQMTSDELASRGYGLGGYGLYAGSRGSGLYSVSGGAVLAPRSRMPEVSSVTGKAHLLGHVGNPAMASNAHLTNFNAQLPPQFKY